MVAMKWFCLENSFQTMNAFKVGMTASWKAEMKDLKKVFETLLRHHSEMLKQQIYFGHFQTDKS